MNDPNKPVDQKVTTTPELTQKRVQASRASKTKGRKAVEKLGQKLEKLNIIYINVDRIKPNDWNPNRQSDHDFALLLKSMEDDGFTQPVIVLKNPDPTDDKHIVVDGEHRWRAGKTLGYAEVPCVLVDMTAEQARVATIRHNRARGSHDVELEAALLRDLEKMGALEFAIDALDLDEVETRKLLDDIAAPDALANESFSSSWVPDDYSQADKDLITTGTQSTVGREVKPGENGSLGAGTTLVGMSSEAIEAMRRRETMIAQAKTDQDRRVAQQQNDIYRLSLDFSGEEGIMVRKALGDQPAVNLLQLCRDKVAALDAAVAPQA